MSKYSLFLQQALHLIASAFSLAFILQAGGCSQSDEKNYQPQYTNQPPQTLVKPNYVLGIFPAQNPVLLLDVYEPLVDRLNTLIPGVHFALEASRNYEDYEKKLYNRHFDLALSNPYQAIIALESGYRIFGKMADDNDFRGVILVRKDSDIRAIGDLKGRKLSFPAATALAATMLPQQYLQDHELPITAYESLYVGSQESSIMNVYLGNTAAGVTWPPAWQAFQHDHSEQAAQLTIQWQTKSLPNNSLIARDDFPQTLLKQVAGILFNLQNSEEGQAILARIQLSRFESASTKTYDPVRRFVAHFDKTVRHLGH